MRTIMAFPLCAPGLARAPCFALLPLCKGMKNKPNKAFDKSRNILWSGAEGRAGEGRGHMFGELPARLDGPPCGRITSFRG